MPLPLQLDPASYNADVIRAGSFDEIANIISLLVPMVNDLSIRLARIGVTAQAAADAAQATADLMGTWIEVSFDATNFDTSGGGAWTVIEANQRDFRYIRTGDFLIVYFVISESNVGAGPGTDLRIKIPGGFTVDTTARQTGYLFYEDAGASAAAGAVIVDGTGSVADKLLCIKFPLGTNWTATAGSNTLVRGFILFQIAG